VPRYWTAACAGLLLAFPALALADLTPCDAAFGELVQRSAQLSECEMNRFMYENIPSVLGRCTLEERQVLEESREGFAEDMQRLCPAPVVREPAKGTPAAPMPPAKQMPEFPPGLESL
jgi:hypothetical protein